MTGSRKELPRGALVAGIAAVALVAAVGWRLRDRVESANETVSQAQLQSMSLEDLQALVAAEPDNLAVWERLGSNYFARNMFAEAAAAYERAATIDGERADLWSALGEARVMASTGDPLPAPALESFRKALSLDPGDHRARYFLAVEKDLADDHEGAIADWLALLADTPPGAIWEADLVRTIEQVGAINEIEVAARIAEASGQRNILPDAATRAIPGPTSEQMAAAASLSPGEQDAMVEQMVSSLAARLDSNPADVDGWIMLMRSYMTLGRTDEARAALSNAKSANPGAAAALDQAAATLGIS